MYKEIEGNLFDPALGFDAIGHGVNVYGVMGAGIAVGFRKNYPDMYEDYRDRCLTGRLEPGGLFAYQAADGKYVYNIASQDAPGPNAAYDWLVKALTLTFQHAQTKGVKSLGLPLIGCGIGGLDESLVVAIIKLFALNYPDIDVTVVRYKP